MNVGKLMGMCKLCFYEYGKILWVCAWIYLWVLANFEGIVEKCCWVCGIYLCMKLWNFFFFSWTCRNFLFAWLWQNLVVVWICDKFGSSDNLVGH